MRKLSLYLLVALLTGGANSNCRTEMPTVCKEYYDLSAQVREEEFPNYPLEKQLAIFRCEMNMKPPNTGLAYEIANGGEKIIPILMENTIGEKDEWIRVQFISIFRIMSEKGYLSGRQDVVDQIREIVSKIRVNRNKEQAEKALNKIEKSVVGSRIRPPGSKN